MLGKLGSLFLRDPLQGQRIYPIRFHGDEIFRHNFVFWLLLSTLCTLSVKNVFVRLHVLHRRD